MASIRLHCQIIIIAFHPNKKRTECFWTAAKKREGQYKPSITLYKGLSCIFFFCFGLFMFFLFFFFWEPLNGVQIYVDKVVS